MLAQEAKTQGRTNHREAKAQEITTMLALEAKVQDLTNLQEAKTQEVMIRHVLLRLQEVAIMVEVFLVVVVLAAEDNNKLLNQCLYL